MNNAFLYWGHNNYYMLEEQGQIRQSIYKIWFLKFGESIHGGGWANGPIQTFHSKIEVNKRIEGKGIDSLSFNSSKSSKHTLK